MSTFPPRHKNPRRPYSRRTKEFGYSVTTVLGALGGGDGLMWGAVNLTADFVLDQPEEWQHLDRDAAWDRIRKHFRGIWDGRAAMGTLTHSVNEAWTWGETVDLDELVQRVAYDLDEPDESKRKPVRSWHGRESFVAADAEGYVDGLERFWRDFAPETIGTEEIVRYTDKAHPYIGTRDWTVRLRGIDGVGLVDIKTTAQRDEDKGLYFDKHRLQLAAYRGASEIVRFDGRDVAESWPNYPVDWCGVLHLRGDGRYQLFDVRAAGDELATFLRLVDLHRWSSSGHKTPAPVDRTIYLASEESETAA